MLSPHLSLIIWDERLNACTGAAFHTAKRAYSSRNNNGGFLGKRSITHTIFNFIKGITMDAVFRIKASEFDEKFFHQLKNVLGLKNNLEITISISEQSTGILREETKEEYFDRLLSAKQNLNNNTNVVSYKPDQFEEFEKFLLNEPGEISISIHRS